MVSPVRLFDRLFDTTLLRPTKRESIDGGSTGQRILTGKGESLDALTEVIVAETELRKRLGGRELDGWFLIEHSDPECTDRFWFLRPHFHCLEDIGPPHEWWTPS